MDTRDLLIEILRELKIDPTGVDADSRLREDLDVDSTEMVEIAVATEKRLSIVIDTDQFLRIRTFGGIVDYISGARI